MWVLALLALLGSTPTGLPQRMKQPPVKGDPYVMAVNDMAAQGSVAVALDGSLVRDADGLPLCGPDTVYYRYFWINPSMHTLKERQEWWQELNILCNRVSREPDIYYLKACDKDYTLFRINLFDFGLYDRRAETWERLVDPYLTYKIRTKDEKGQIEGAPKVDRASPASGGALPSGNPRQQIEAMQKAGRPYRLTTVDTYTQDGETWTFKVEADDGKPVPAARSEYGKNDKQKQATNAGKFKTALAPWWNSQAVKDLVDITQSRMPMVRGEWFFNQISIQQDRQPGYYDFLGVKNEKDFDELVGFDAKILKTFPKEYREATPKKAGFSPTHQPRRIDVAWTVGGPYWRTSDNRRAVDERDPLRVLDTGYKYEARESLGHLPSGLLAAGLFGGNLDFDTEVLKKDVAKKTVEGARADIAPDFIASDRFAPDTDKRIHVGMSCWRCHDTGIHDLAGFNRTTFQAPFGLQFTDPVEYKRLTRLYMTELESSINLSRSIYANAVMRSTRLMTLNAQGKPLETIKGLTPTQESALQGDKWQRYENAVVDRKWAAKDLGVTEGQLVAGITNNLRTVGNQDPLLTNFIAGDLPLTIRQWEELHPLAKVVMLGIAPVN